MREGLLLGGFAELEAGLQVFLQVGPEGSGGEAHHVVVGAINAGDGSGADPFLDAVGTGFVVGLVAVHIISDVCVRQFGEVHQGTVGETFHPIARADADAGGDGVGFSGEFTGPRTATPLSLYHPPFRFLNALAPLGVPGPGMGAGHTGWLFPCRKARGYSSMIPSQSHIFSVV